MTKAALAYLKDPAAIYQQSFATIRGEADLAALPNSLHPVAIRLIHACGMTDLPASLAFGGDVAAKVAAALRAGAPIYCDCQMVAAGIIGRYLPGNDIRVTLNDPQTAPLAKELGTTRSAAALERWKDGLAGAICVIGNAPTALFHLLEMIEAGSPRPAAILAFPVGFVGAAESKQALTDSHHQIPFLTLLGRRGGSAMAAAALNGLAAGLPEEQDR